MSDRAELKKCANLYKKYKKTCNDVDIFNQCSIKPIIEMSIDELDIYIKDTILKFNKTKKCYDQRQKHREKCINIDEYDKGHDKQFMLLKQQLDLCEDIIKQGYKRLEIEMGKLNKVQKNLETLDRKNKVIQSDKKEKIYLDNQPSKKTKILSKKKSKINVPNLENDSIFDIFQNQNTIYNDKHKDLLKEIASKRDDIGDVFTNRYNIVYKNLNLHNHDTIDVQIYSMIGQKVLVDIFVNYIINTVSPSLTRKLYSGSFGNNSNIDTVIDQNLTNKQLTQILDLLISFNNYTPYFQDIDRFVKNNC